MIYGTAWKEQATAGLVLEALAAGFRAIDTANQKKHYREDFVGDALLGLKQNGIERKDLFLQSKYTYREGQDHRLPYDPAADFGTQVRSSFASSLKNLHTDYLDSYLLHGPRTGRGLTDADWEVWTAMEDLHQSGQARSIGVSNVSLDQIRELFEKARIKPQSVQNRCYASRGWDGPVRAYCAAHQIVYQGFSLLTANPHIVSHPEVLQIATRRSVTPAQILFAFAGRIGILPLTGTTDSRHMKEDLIAPGLVVTPEEVERILTL